ncbi:MAG: protein-L-isoaspartate O-methyltransferase family protein [Euzebya sp.]
MVADLLTRGDCVSDDVVRALHTVPRHQFLPEVDSRVAYENDAQLTLIRRGVALSSVSQPSIVAQMLEAGHFAAGHRVLEIGTGRGYNTALLAELVGPRGQVFSVDIEPGLVHSAAATVGQLGYEQIQLAVRDGRQGWPDHAPFDRIIVTAGASEVAQAWSDQLSESGLLIVPLSPRRVCVVFERVDGVLAERRGMPAGFLPVRDPE